MPHLKLLAALLALAFVAVVPAQAGAQTTAPPGFQVQTSVSGFSQAVASAYAPDGRVFAIEKKGRLRVARTDGTLAPTLILDISARVNSYGDRGLLGLALDKDFASNGYAYLLYAYELNPMSPDTVGPAVSRLTRIKINADNTIANAGTNPETVILGTYNAGPCPAADNAVDCIPADYHWHTIGTVRSDPVDGTLWVGSGDASSGSTQQQAFRTYDEASFAGKLIHIDRDGRGLQGHPFCPGETDLQKVCTKLYAKGFRNPFRFTLRPGKGPVVGDVGHTMEEEIDLVKPGRNYGWPCYEGTRKPGGYALDSKCQALYAKEGTAEGATAPHYTYPHGDGASVNGGPQYTGTAYPAEYRGDVFFGDYVQGWIKRLKVDANDNVLGVEPFATGVPAFIELETDPTGRLAFVDAGGFAAGQGAIRRFDYSGDLAPAARASATPTTGAAPLAVQFTGSTSSDPEGKALTYDWDFGDGTARGTTANPAHTYTANGTYTAKLTVKDPIGNVGTATVRITVGNTAPTATITSPASTFQYVTGETVQLSATASDAQDGTVAGTGLSWQVILHHGTHIHEHAAATGATASFPTDAGHDADSYYEVRLTATDSGGLTDTKSVVIKPKTVKYALNSSPPGAPLSYSGGTLAAAPVRVTAAVGFKPSVNAAETFVSGGRTYRFQGWSDGGARAHDASIPAKDGALLATYVADGVQTFTFSPTADAYVDASIPTANKGGSSQIGVDGSPLKQTLLRFDVSGLRGGRVVGTRLTLFGNDSSNLGGRIFPVTGAWTETGVTWDTRPAFGTTQLGAFGAVRGHEWSEAALTGAVTGDGTVSLGMDSTSTDSALYASRHQVSSKPRLTVEVEPVPTETLTFTPEADTSVSAAAPAQAFGTSTTLWADNDPVRHTYLRFGVTGVAGRQIVGAKLRMYQADASRTGGTVKKLSSTTWSEGITWDTRPVIDGATLGTFGAVVKDQWYELDLAPGAVTADGLASFGITSTSTDSAGWRSRETLTKPQLILSVATP